jgi:hypothetical protein
MAHEVVMNGTSLFVEDDDVPYSIPGVVVSDPGENTLVPETGDLTAAQADQAD